MPNQLQHLQCHKLHLLLNKFYPAWNGMRSLRGQSSWVQNMQHRLLYILYHKLLLHFWDKNMLSVQCSTRQLCGV